MKRLFFASTLTLGLLGGFVFGIIFLIMLYSSSINIYLAIGLTIFFNVLFWLIGPTFSDLINKWFHKIKFLTKEEFSGQHPEIAQLIESVCVEYKFKFPKIGIIPDKNPTAFTYGSGRYNARLVLTEGIFTFLNVQEQRAVVAHEMGHVVNRDFIVMMIASTLVQILYEIYSVTMRGRIKSRKKGGALVLIGAAAYLLHIIGIYLLLYLSRTREYLADAFSTKLTNPDDLANALIKIGYGIVAAADDESSKQLLQATRRMGIIDVKNAKHIGVASYISHGNPNVLSEVMVFDAVSWWAKLAQFNSTHPLTGNRISELNKIAVAKGQPQAYNVVGAVERMAVDRSKLRNDFLGGVLILLLPYILIVATFFLLPLQLLPAAIGIGVLLQLPYKFGRGAPKETTVLEQMRDPYSSPLRGRPITLSGQVIGRGIPGYIFSEDVMYQDSTGLIFLDYISAFGFIGDLFFALAKVKKLLGLPSKVTGWFYRGMGSSMKIKNLKTDTLTIKSHPMLWTVILPILLIGLSIFFMAISPAWSLFM